MSESVGLLNQNIKKNFGLKTMKQVIDYRVRLAEAVSKFSKSQEEFEYNFIWLLDSIGYPLTNNYDKGTNPLQNKP